MPTPTTTRITTIIAARTIVRLFGFGDSVDLGACSIFSHVKVVPGEFLL